MDSIINFKEFKKGFDQFDWSHVKKMTQTFKRKTKLGSYTVDEEFDFLYKTFINIEISIKTIVKYCQTFTKESKNQLQISCELGKIWSKLFDPYNSLPLEVREKMNMDKMETIRDEILQDSEVTKTFQSDHKTWEKVKVFSQVVDEMSEQVDFQSLASTTITIQKYCNELQKILENIKAKIKQRNETLDDYDSVYNELDNLHLKSKTRELSIKEIQTQMNLQRKLDFYKNNYEMINNLFKKEFPYFFTMYDTFLHSLLSTLLHSHINFSSKLNQQLVILRKQLDISKNEFVPEKIMAEVEPNIKQATNDIEMLEILRFKDIYYQQLAISDITLTPKYCKAIYAFNGQQHGDLSIKVGDVIKIIKAKDGWWKGQIGDRVGMFPLNYVQPL